MTRTWVGLAIVASLISACGGGGGTCVPTTDISGIWMGMATNDSVSRGDSGGISATITQDGCILGGNWAFDFPKASLLNRQFTIVGSSPQGPAVALDLEVCTGIDGACDTVETCQFLVTGTMVSGSEISGTYTTDDNCSFSETGDFDITLQARLTPTPTFTTTPLPPPTPTPTPPPTPTP